jgi:predicted DNA-binding transcriptional regulator AlpA
MNKALHAAADTESAESLIAIEHVANRFGRTVATIENWLKCGEMEFPRPKYIRRRRYFSSRELAQWERQFSDNFAPRDPRA